MNDKRKSIYEKYNGKCAYCGMEIKLSEMQVDHVIPKQEFLYHVRNKIRVPLFLKHLTEADVNHKDNLMPTCRFCNKWKSAYDLELFRRELSEQIARLNNYSANYRIAKRYGQLVETPNPILFYFENQEK